MTPAREDSPTTTAFETLVNQHNACRVEMVRELAFMRAELKVLSERFGHLRILLMLIAIAAGCAPLAQLLGGCQRIDPHLTAAPELRASGASTAAGVGMAARAETIIGTVQTNGALAAWSSGVAVATSAALAAIAWRYSVVRRAALRTVAAIERSDSVSAKVEVAKQSGEFPDSAERWIRAAKGRFSGGGRQ